ncbi:MAG: hypothetical protein EB084_14695 [Proteobacteria bacterium]|nr:hypothetical protein [Pseudomonadota bacterium]
MTMIPQIGLDKDKLQQYLAMMLAAMSPVMMQALEMDAQRQAQLAEESMTRSGATANLAREDGMAATEEQPRIVIKRDSYEDYNTETLADGRLIKRFEDGTVRIENPKTGLIQEERKDGTFLVSLPGGRLLYQAFAGDPLLAYNLNEANSKPVVAQVAMTHLPGKEEATMVYTFVEDQHMHVIDAESLRYFRTRADKAA